MSIYHVNYQTTNKYENPVKEALIVLLILPKADESQQFISFSIENNLNLDHFLMPNMYGFDRIMFRPSRPFSQLDINFQCQLEMEDINPYENIIEPLTNESEIIQSLDFKIDHQLFLKPTPSTRISKELLPDVLIKSDHQSSVEFLQTLNAFIFNQFQFEDQVDSLSNVPADTLKNNHGVCQDFAQFFIAVCRANKIPARYVSGYLNQGDGHIGSAMMHAWAEAYIPGTGWQGYDPTNNLMRDSHYIKVCHGTDYSDCAPIKGVLNTHGSNVTDYKVTVSQQAQQ
ncbi:transglutaminase-like domain-containing protein [Reichenbachiella ulvae]|uniref:Transglutaminase family protein n=1 Tax=Reichenbachiella ulvae TaxID=2980104 RepID=A0ABT3CN96_9BACT|nr:transglutaminase family protein [Reichenbachiella ulvae]MCV9385146.1 transglutaminase family protein [Reichenbachiella ulvae]